MPEQKFAKYFLLLLGITTGIILPFTYLTSSIDPDTTPRYLALAVFLSLAVALIVVFSLLKKPNTKTDLLNYSFVHAILLFVCFLCISILTAINKGDAVFYVVKNAVMLVLIFAGAEIIRHHNKEPAAILCGVNSCFVVFTFFGVKDMLPAIIPFIHKGGTLQLNYEVCSLLVNKNFYAETILFCLPFLFYGCFSSFKILKIISLLNTAVCILSVLILQTVSVYISLVAAVLFAIVLLFKYRHVFFTAMKIKRKSLFAIPVSLLVIAVSGIYFFYKANSFKTVQVKTNMLITYYQSPALIDSTSSVNNNSVFERLLMIRNSVRMFKEHPFWGVGSGGWKIYMPKYGFGGTPHLNYGIVHFEHPHNDYLFTLTEGGIFSFIISVVIFILILFYGMRLLKSELSKKEKFFILLMMSGIVSFMTESLLAYPKERFFSWYLVCLMMMFIFSFYRKVNAGAVRQVKVITIYLPCFFLCVFGAYVFFNRMKSEMHLQKALVAQMQKNWLKMESEAHRTNTFFFPLDYTATPMCWYEGFAAYYSGNVQNAFRLFKEAEKINPYHLQLLNDIGTCYEMTGDHLTALSYYNKALQMNPRFPDGLFNACTAYFNMGETENAYQMLRRYTNSNRSTRFLHDLAVVLRAKAFKVSNETVDESLKVKLLKKLNDSKWLITVHDRSIQLNTTFESELIKDITASK